MRAPVQESDSEKNIRVSLLCDSDSSLYLSDRELEERYDQSLDECLGTIKIGSLEYSPSEVLKSVDFTAYVCGFADWLEAECTDGGLVDSGEYYLEKDTYDRL